MFSRIWDYIMRRKVLLLVGILLIGGLAASLGAVARPSRVGRSHEQQPHASLEYNHSLVLTISGSAGAPSYQLEFSEDFSRATITVSAAPLASDTYVRILNAAGQLVSGTYTKIQDLTPTAPAPDAFPDESDDGNLASEIEADPDETIDEGLEDETPELTPEPPALPGGVEYVFADAPKTETVLLEPGYIIEIHSTTAQFYSTLDQSLAESYTPTDTTTQYVVMSGGIRRLEWSDAEGIEHFYQLVRRYLVGIIEDYQQNTPPAILANKNLDLERKLKVIQAYNELRISDQEPYLEFIALLRRGGVPELVYSGETSYLLGTEVDFSTLITAYDNEDGELPAEAIAIESEVDLNQVGSYRLAYLATDSDGNTTMLELTISVVSPDPGLPPLDTLPEDPGLEDEVEFPTTDTPPTTPEAPSEEPSQDTPPAAPSLPTPPLSGGGANTEDLGTEDVNQPEPPATSVEVADSESTQAAASAVEVSETLNTERRPTNDSATTTQHRFPLGRILLIGFGLLFLAGLVRFIFDHYVR